MHVGNRLVILFDNRSTVTLDPFFGPGGEPLQDVAVHLGPDHDVSGADFAALFPITTDQSVLPAAGGGAGPTAGAHFGDPTVDALSTFTPLALLNAENAGSNFGDDTSLTHDRQPDADRRRGGCR